MRAIGPKTVAIPRKLGEFTARAVARKAIIVSAVICALLILFLGRSYFIHVPAAAIDRITVRGDSGKTVFVITDAERIQKSVAFIHSRTRGWTKPWDTFPSAQYSVSFESNGTPMYVVWIGHDGTNWVGYRAFGGTSADNVLKDISGTERSELLHDLGL